MNRFALLLCLILLANCREIGKATEPSESTSVAKPTQKIDPCSLATTDEVGAIQKARMTQQKSTESSDGNLVTSQCYYASAEPDASVVLLLIQRDPSHHAERTPRDVWRQILGQNQNESSAGERNGKGPAEKEQRENREAESEKTSPQKIGGLGEEAFWFRTPLGGMLYVLKNNRVLRINFGGPDKPEMKLEKCKALANKALARL